MTKTEILALVVTIIGAVCFSAVLTLLFTSYAKASKENVKAGKRDVDLIQEIVHDADLRTIKKKKRRKIIGTVITSVLLVITIPILALSLYDRIGGNVTSIGGYSLLVVASGSMSEQNEANTYLKENNINNQFNTYDMVILEKRESYDNLQKYDVIAYKNDKGTNIIHRIIQVVNDSSGVSYITRGDSNNASDVYHPTPKDIIGVYTNKKINGLGVLILFFQSPSGIVTFLALIYCLIMIDKVSGGMDAAETERKTMIHDAIQDQLKEGLDHYQADYQETITYNGFRYEFTEKGFVGKTEIRDGMSQDVSETKVEETQDEKVLHKE